MAQVSTLPHAALIEHCVEHLFIHGKTSAIGYPYDVLNRGFQILHDISQEWSSSSTTSANDNLEQIICISLTNLSHSDAQALYHTLSTLVGYDSWLKIEDGVHRFEIGVCLWALRLGPRGLAQGWEDGRKTIGALFVAEQRYLTVNREVADNVEVLRSLNRESCAWGRETRRCIMAEEEEARRDRDDYYD